ncbi:lipoprotein [Zoogloea sp.]|uniref:LPS translocon maturation chaperone LptM n=1 Tax=Zoogloea sp. TaxID=49181 RepID=UPI00260371E2|nr:lipoprotein [Zoogloea sp.]MDD3352888.1 lipoprotein [Zoogloea sp.]
MRNIAFAAATCGTILLAGCGIKGPLYLPQIPRPAAQATQPAEPAPIAPKGATAVDHNKPAPQDIAQ